MKKLTVLFAALILTSMAIANNPFSITQSLNNELSYSLAAPEKIGNGSQHTEFRYYGIYGIVDLCYWMNIAPVHDALPEEGFAGYDDAYALMGFTASAGFQWRKESAVGIGFSFLNDMNGSFSQIPVFFEYRSHFTRNRLTPYSSIQLGYSVPFGSSNEGPDYVKINKGGLTFGVEGGARFAFSRFFAMNLGVGYQLIQCQEVERGTNGIPGTRMPELYHNLKVNIGFNF